MAEIFAPGLLKGQVAVVTGGGTGIGRGIALELARAGADLVIAARRLDRLGKAAEEIRELGVRCLVVQTDVRVRDQVQNMVDRTVAEFGRLDIMVNNAAGNFNVKAEDLSPNGFNSVIQIDLYGTFNCSQIAGEVMRRQKYGRIINILTSFLWNTSPGAVHAHSAKAGVWAMTQTLATEWARYGINVNAIAPGPFVVETAAEHWGRTEDDQRRNAARLPVGRMGRVEEMGWVAVFLASPAGDFICGETIVIDGGRKVFLGGGSHPDWVYDRSEGPASNTFPGPAPEGA